MVVTVTREVTNHVRMGTRTGRWVLASTVLGSGVAFLDATIVNVALPRIQTGLGASLSDLQWVLDAYLLTLGALILVGGALGDLLGRRRVFLVGLVGFGLASVACGLAPTPVTLIAARAVQGVAGALLVPGSLAIITAGFEPADRGRAIGAWSGLASVSTALGPFAGGYLVDVASWRWAFFVNVPLITAAIIAAVRHVPESTALAPSGHRLSEYLDVRGGLTAVVGLALLIYPLIEATRLAAALIAVLLAAGAAALWLFVVVERRQRLPMLPLELFRSRTFTVANLITLAVYGGLGAALFLLSLELQNRLGYSAFDAGAALLPLTVLLLLLSSRVGALLPRIGLRLPLTVGPLLAGVGLLLLVRVHPGASYAGSVLPGVLVFALGMCLVVAPVTTAALASVDEAHSGAASGVNNAAARIAGLVAVAVLPLAAGLSTTTTTARSNADFTTGFHRAMVIAAALLFLGAVTALVGLGEAATDTVRS